MCNTCRQWTFYNLVPGRDRSISTLGPPPPGTAAPPLCPPSLALYPCCGDPDDESELESGELAGTWPPAPPTGVILADSKDLSLTGRWARIFLSSMGSIGSPLRNNSSLTLAGLPFNFCRSCRLTEPRVSLVCVKISRSSTCLKYEINNFVKIATSFKRTEAPSQCC